MVSNIIAPHVKRSQRKTPDKMLDELFKPRIKSERSKPVKSATDQVFEFIGESKSKKDKEKAKTDKARETVKALIEKRKRKKANG